LPQRLLAAVDRHPSPRAQMRRLNGRWESIAALEMLRRIAGLAAALADRGVAQGDRVAIFAPNCPEWHVADFAIAGLGAVAVPIYFRESVEHIEYIAGHARPKIIFVAGEEQPGADSSAA
jgi:long-chain acyl-CoA synthetase